VIYLWFDRLQSRYFHIDDDVRDDRRDLGAGRPAE
jgi:hypothetical protein